MTRPCETCAHFLPRLPHQDFDFCNKWRLLTGVARFSANHCGDDGRDWRKARGA